MEEMENAMVQKSGGARLKKGGKKPLIVIGILLAVLATAYLGVCAYAGSLEVFYPNTTINEVDVAGCTVAEATERLRAELPGRQVEFYLPLPDQTGDGISAPEGDTLYDEAPAATVTYRDLGVTEELDYENDAQLVFDLAQVRTGFFTRGWNYLGCLFGSMGTKGITLEPEEDIFQSQMEQLSGQFSKEPQDTAYTVDENGLQVTLAQNGLAVSPAALAEDTKLLFSSVISEDPGRIYVADAQILSAKTMTAQEMIRRSCRG